MIQACLRPAGAFLLMLGWGPLLAFDPDVRWDASMAGCNGQINDLAEGPDGRIYVGGAFSECGGVAVANVAVYDPGANSWQALDGNGGNGVDGLVNALAFYQGQLYVGGNFQQTAAAEPIAANRLARWDPVSESWFALETATGNGVSGQVHALLTHGNELVIGGDFFSANVGDPVTVQYVVRWDGETWVTLASPDGGYGTTNTVRALASSNEALYVGGEFTAVNFGGTDSSFVARRIARWNSTQGWSALGSGGGNGVNDQVFSLEWADGLLYVGGLFGAANSGDGFTASRVAVWDGSQWLTMGTETGQGASQAVQALVRFGQRTYLGGVISQVNVGDPLAVSGLAWWDGDSFGALGSGVDGNVRRIMPGSDGWLYVGGSFTEAGGQAAARFARYRPGGDFNLEFSGSGSGSIEIAPVGLSCAEDCSLTLDWDQTLIVNADPAPFSQFAGFSGDACSGTSPCTFNFEQDITVVAQFDLVSHAVEVTEQAGNGSVTPASQAIEHGATANWAVSPDPGWAVHAFTGDTCSPQDNGDGTWSATGIVASCELEIEFRPDVEMTVSLSMNPAVIGVSVTYEVALTSTVFIPVDGQVTVVASTGENCIDSTQPPPSDGLTVFYTCDILYSGTGPRPLQVNYSGSSTHVAAEDGSIVQQVVGDEFIFRDRFEED
ncbi:MAG: delta-60 repeat domain-containing protein [Wenzhouxiangella sp.]|nr:delta-60 repeat domain-containing protein [Wenzhouxiangella sp.]